MGRKTGKSPGRMGKEYHGQDVSNHPSIWSWRSGESRSERQLDGEALMFLILRTFCDSFLRDYHYV